MSGLPMSRSKGASSPRRRLRAALVAGLAAVGGCKKVEPAPKELDRLFPWFFTGIEDRSDEELAEGLRNLHEQARKLGLGETHDGSISRLEAADLEGMGIERDPAKAAGVYLLNPLACGLGQLDRILSYKDQDELYEGVYDRYDREFTSERERYLNREVPELTWTVNYEATILGKSYESDIDGMLRAVPALDSEQSPYGEFLIARAYIPRPARFDSGNVRLDQDYQIEIYYNAPGAGLLHAYGLWREADFGGGITSENEGSQRLLLNELAAWDEDTAALCEAGQP
jgi:hypothetical protein